MITSKEKLTKLVEVINNSHDVDFTLRDLAKKITSSDNRRELESLAGSIGVMLNVLVSVGLVGKKERRHGQAIRVTFHRIGKVGLYE
jgi:hypothetical protein